MQVKGEGSLDAKIYIIGEAPGASEDRAGQLFIGGTGRVLDSILSEVGIKRSEVYVDNVIQWRPKGNDFGIYYKDKSKKQPTETLLAAHQKIKDLVREHRPNVVVALGIEALYALTGYRAITKWRGSILGCGGVKVIPTIHPAMVMRQYEFRPCVVMDFNRIVEEAKTSAFPKPYRDNFLISPSFEQIMVAIKELHQRKYIAFDIETDRKQILCMGFAWSDHDSVCIPIFYAGTSMWTEMEEFAIIIAMKELFANPNINFIAQNAQYDMIFIADKWGIDVANLWMDTMVAFHCVYPELRKGLDFLSSVYTNRPYHKGMPGSGGGAENLWVYNCLDTVVTWECAMKIKEELNEFGTAEFYNNHSHKLIKPLISIQRRGVRINTGKRAEIDQNLSEELDSLQRRLDEGVGHALNVNSPKQMKDLGRLLKIRNCLTGEGLTLRAARCL